VARRRRRRGPAKNKLSFRQTVRRGGSAQPVLAWRAAPAREGTRNHSTATPKVRSCTVTHEVRELLRNCGTTPCGKPAGTNCSGGLFSDDGSRASSAYIVHNEDTHQWQLEQDVTKDYWLGNASPNTIELHTVRCSV